MTIKSLYEKKLPTTIEFTVEFITFQWNITSDNLVRCHKKWSVFFVFNFNKDLKSLGYGKSYMSYCYLFRAHRITVQKLNIRQPILVMCHKSGFSGNPIQNPNSDSRLQNPDFWFHSVDKIITYIIIRTDDIICPYIIGVLGHYKKKKKNR